MLAKATVAVVPAEVGGRPTAADKAAATVALRLTHDLRRLKEIKSIEKKIAAKREMLPEYAPWVEGVIAAAAGVGAGISADVVPTVMVWLIDVGQFEAMLPLAAFVLRHDVSMPARYNRDAATVIVEETAAAALKLQGNDERFPLEVLCAVEEMTAGIDMHDEPRAKLAKAIGIEQLELAASFDGQAERTAREAALASLRRAVALDDRIGVKGRITQLEKALAPTDTAAPAA
jgi:hypothetical protein